MPTLPQAYQRAVCPNSPINEVLLFHGATDDVLEKIRLGGFDPLRGGESAGKLFGAGTYFTPCFSKADLYTDSERHPRCKTAERHVMVAKIILGNFQQDKVGYSNRRRPDEDDRTGMLLDSVVAATREEGGAVDHPEAVIFKSEQALPMFMITYQHADGCRCHMCLRRPD